MDGQTLIIVHLLLVMFLYGLSLFKQNSVVLYGLTTFAAIGWMLSYWQISPYIGGAMLIVAVVSGYNAVTKI